MSKVDETKLQVLRGVVQDNVDVQQGVKTNRIILLPRPRQRQWIWGILLTVGIVYLAVPSSIISFGKASAPATPIPAITFPTMNTAPEAGLAKPKPLNRDLFPLSLKRIVIDPGHGGAQTGAIAATGLTEKEITLDVALRLRRLLAPMSYDVKMTRESDQTLSLENRVEFANANKADLFLSIHINWMEPRTIRGLETFFVGPTDDPETMKLVSRENRESGFSFTDLRKALDKIYIDARRNESRALASIIQQQLFTSLKLENPHLTNRGVKTAPFAVLVGTQMPAILAEVACLSHEDEVKLLTKKEYREKIALALLDGIRTYADNINRINRKGT